LKPKIYHLPPMMDSYQWWRAPMSDQMKIDAALANLEADKFSLRMVDAIKNHISGLENELEVVRGLHSIAIRDLNRVELSNWRLEGELKKLNAKIHALLKANVLTEKAYAGLTVVALKTGAFFVVSKKFAGPALQRVIADLKSGKLQSQCVDAAAKLYALLKEIMPTRSTLREMTAYADKLGEYLAVAQKYGGAQLEKASAYLATLNKTAA
jgi:hypothetical protein